MDKFFIIPHTHYDAEVFLPREEFLEVGYKVIIDVLNALKSDPDYKFTLDQAAYIGPFLREYPELREPFLEMVTCGRLEIVGGMYVMLDLNVVSGESIVRQFELGKEYFRGELGVDVKTAWMIDTFGHCLQMPQIARKCGLERYVFCRAADRNQSEFHWKGIDGTTILTHWMPFHYNVFCDSPHWFEGFRDFVLERYNKLKPYAATEALAAPEGGDFTRPVRHDAEFARRWNAEGDRPFDLIVGTPGEFFAEVEKQRDSLEIDDRELNPVFQGCYSARIRVKQQNAMLENMLYEAEVWNALAPTPRDTQNRLIAEAWELILFNQGHDDMGGVQMDMVFEHVQRRYRQAEHLAALAAGDALDALARRIETSGRGNPLVVFNPLAWPRTQAAAATVAFDEDDVFTVGVEDHTGRAAPVQTEVLERHANGAIRQVKVAFAATCPALGYAVHRIVKNGRNPAPNPYRTGKWYGMEELNEGVLENEHLRIRLDLWKGCITSLVLKETGEEYIDPQMPYGNMLVKNEDNGDFWEIGTPLRGGANRPVKKIQRLEPGRACTELSVDKGVQSFLREGDLVSECEFILKTAGYDFTSIIRLYAGARSVEFETRLVNRQRNVRYRIAFPTNIRGGTITHGIPFGSVERPEGEYPALRWADYSDSGRGLGLINCGLPGNAVVDGTMMLSIMKCTSFVSYGGGGYDPANSSEGGYEIGVPHTFRYALVPHKGDWREAGLPRMGEELNHPFTVKKALRHEGALPPAKSFLAASSAQVMGSCLREWDGGMMLRVWEACGRPAAGVRVETGFGPCTAVETDMLGGPLNSSAPIPRDGTALVLDFRPYEVRTLLLRESTSPGSLPGIS